MLIAICIYLFVGSLIATYACCQMREKHNEPSMSHNERIGYRLAFVVYFVIVTLFYPYFIIYWRWFL